jgi:hypothetical protein
MKESIRFCRGSFYGKSEKESSVHLTSNLSYPKFSQYNKKLIIKFR